MGKSFSEIWKISGIIYKEIVFQSIFSLRLGAPMPAMGNTKIDAVVRQAKVSMVINKVLITIFIIFMGILPISYWSLLGALPQELAVAGSTSVYLASLLFLLMMLGLQITTSFFSTKSFEVLGTMPVSKDDLAKIALISFIRIFDIPIIAALIIFPIAYTVLTGAVLGGLATLLATAVTEAFALATTMIMAKFFYSRIAVGGEASKYKTFMRFIYMLIWILPSFGIYFIMNFATELLNFFASSMASIFQGQI
ncbi:hypothetical protein H5T51_06575, partial [Candidatus Bathyarchaeota archaeon]|nr:hypothetical protein [Candidatus Bathyarchaeota archaeon]